MPLQLLLVILRLADVRTTPATAAGYGVAMRTADRALFCADKCIRARTRKGHTNKGDTMIPDHSTVLRCCWKWPTSQSHALDVKSKSGIGLSLLLNLTEAHTHIQVKTALVLLILQGC